MIRYYILGSETTEGAKRLMDCLQLRSGQDVTLKIMSNHFMIRNRNVTLSRRLHQSHALIASSLSEFMSPFSAEAARSIAVIPYISLVTAPNSVIGSDCVVVMLSMSWQSSWATREW